MTQLERAQPLVGVPRNVAAPLPPTPSPVALQPQGVVPRPAVPSEGQRMAAVFMTATGMVANLIGTAATVSAAEERHLEGLADDHYRTLWPDVENEILAGKWGSLTGEELEEEITNRFAGRMQNMPKAYQRRLDNRLRSSAKSTYLTWQRGEIAKGDAKGMSLLARRATSTKTAAEVREILKHGRETYGLDTYDAITKIALPALQVAAAEGDSTEFYNIVEAIRDEAGERFDPDLRSAINAFDKRLKAKWLAKVDLLAQTDPTGAIKLLDDLAETGDLITKAEAEDYKQRVLRTGRQRYATETLDALFLGEKTPEAVVADLKRRAALDEDDPDYAGPATRAPILAAVAQKQVTDLKTAQVIDSMGGGSSFVSKRTHDPQAGEVLRAAGIIDARNHIADPAGLIAAVIGTPGAPDSGLRFLPSVATDSINAGLGSSNPDDVKMSIAVAGPLMRGGLRQEVLDGAPEELKMVLHGIDDAYGSARPPDVVLQQVMSLVSEPPVPPADKNKYELFTNPVTEGGGGHDLDEFVEETLDGFRETVAPTGYFSWDPALDPLGPHVAASMRSWGVTAYWNARNGGLDNEAAYEQAQRYVVAKLRENYDLIPSGSGKLQLVPVKAGNMVVDQVNRYSPVAGEAIERAVVDMFDQETWDNHLGIAYDSLDVGEEQVPTEAEPLAARIRDIGLTPLEPTPIGRWVVIVQNEKGQVTYLTTKTGELFTYRLSGDEQRRNAEEQRKYDVLLEQKIAGHMGRIKRALPYEARPTTFGPPTLAPAEDFVPFE